MSVLRKLRVLKLACRKFPSIIGHVFAAKYTQREHLLGSQIGVESTAKIAPHRLRPPTDIAFLHLVIYFYAQRLQYLVLNRLSEDDYFGGENATISLAAR